MSATIAQRAVSAITENGRLKLVSFGLALLFYSLFHGAQVPRSMPVPLLVRLPPPSAHRALTITPPLQVRLTLRGPKGALEEVRPDDLTVEVDLTDGKTSHVTIDPTHIQVPPSVRVEGVDPPVFDIAWEDEVARDVPVQVSVVGNLAPGLVLRKLTPDPPLLRVNGPKSEVAVLQHVRSEPLDVTNLGAGIVQRQVRIERISGHTSVESGIVGVGVRAEIVPEMTERLFVRVPVSVVSTVKARPQPQEVDIRVRCPPSIEKHLRVEQILPKVTLRPTTPTGTESLSVDVNLPECETAVVPQQVIVRW